jgi:Protein of unknown function (DUF3987)/RepB DNA-primase from phage plasmid
LDAEQYAKFFRLVFGDLMGYLAIARKSKSSRFIESFYEYPNQLGTIIQAIERDAPSDNLYFCPQLFRRTNRKKEYATVVSCLWADLDYCDPEKLLVKPSLLIESSPTRHQALWLLDDPADPFEAEELSKRIAYYHRNDGADISGWDLTQLLRIPYTQNFKYPFPHPTVKIAATRKQRYRPSDFKQYPLLSDQIDVFEAEAPEDLPTGEDIIDRYRSRLPDFAFRLFHTTPDPMEFPKEGGGWSKALWKLEVMCFEAGMSAEEAFAVATDSACNKYERDNRSQTGLWKEVLKAQAHVIAQDENKRKRQQRLTKLTSQDVAPDDGFVHKYYEWAVQQTDAAEIYHEASAIMILSTLLSGMITLPVSFQPRGMKLNLWFMLLGDTTLTRKSTAMKMAVDMLGDVTNDDTVVANDASVEGLAVALSLRPNQPSIFLRDEFSGFIEMMQKRDYYAGMAETLTKLYDGDNVKRQLARSTITIQHPILIMFTGGIRSRILELMNEDYIRSGFLPRFLFFSGLSDINRFRPTAPPQEEADHGRADLVRFLMEAVAKYDVLDTVQLPSGPAMSRKRVWKAQLTPAAWGRYGLAERDLLDDGLRAREPDLFTPVYQRLGISALKLSALLAAVRKDNPKDGAFVEVTLDDVEHALYYAERWRLSAMDVVSSAGTTSMESKMNRILGYIQARAEHGVPKAALLRSFKLTKKESDGYFDTLEARQLIRKITQDGEPVYFPVEE